jgi:hypothetical protein
MAQMQLPNTELYLPDSGHWSLEAHFDEIVAHARFSAVHARTGFA